MWMKMAIDFTTSQDKFQKGLKRKRRKAQNELVKVPKVLERKVQSETFPSIQLVNLIKIIWSSMLKLWVVSQIRVESSLISKWDLNKTK